MPGPVRTPLIGTQRLLVPAYFSPRGTKWRDTCDALRAGTLRSILVMNPDSGPGPAEEKAYTDAIDRCRRQSVIGYVTTDHAQRDPAKVKKDVDRYFDFYPKIRGIFFDEMSNNAGNKPYYRDLYTHVTGKSGTARVVGNPGIPASSAWQVTRPRVADILVVFEGPWVRTPQDDPAVVTQYEDWVPPTWVTERPTELFAHLVYESPDAATTRAICTATQKKHARWIYVTADSRPNPWDVPPDAALLGSPTLERQLLVAPT